MNEDHNYESHNKSESEQWYILPASILVAAILISGSLLYGFNSIINSGATLFGNGQALEQADSGQGVAGQVPEVNVPEREGAAILGNKDAKVSIVEFSDFQCPFCQKFFSSIYPEIKSKYIDSGKVKFEYRHFPLSIHKNAKQAAVASECANREGKFFEYHDLLFKNTKSDGTGLSIPDLKGYASDLGLNTSSFNECLDNQETLEIVQNDLKTGTSLGVSGTPTLFVDGIRIVGAQPIAVFEAAIDKALNK